MNKVHARSKRGKRPARKAPQPGTTATDRRLLAQAAREDVEGKVARDFVQRLVKAMEKAAPKPMPLSAVEPAKAPRPVTQKPELVCSQLAVACDQLALALTTANQGNDWEMVEQIVPVMTTLWSLRMELNSVGGAQ